MNSLSEKEIQAKHNQATTLWLFDVLMVAVQIIYNAAKAGNVQCKEGVKQLELLWKTKP